MMLTQKEVKFDWTAIHHTAFLNLKEAIIQASILCYPLIINTSSTQMHLINAYGGELSQEHDGLEFPMAFLLHAFT